MPIIWTLGPPGKRTRFEYKGNVHTDVTIHYLKSHARVSAAFSDAILDHFRGRSVPGGFSMTKPPPDGLGAWVLEHSPALNTQPLTPRHASHIAAILVREGYARSRLRGKAVWLHFRK